MITKRQLKNLIAEKLTQIVNEQPSVEDEETRQRLEQEHSNLEEPDLGALAGGAIDDTHLLLLETAELYRVLSQDNPGQEDRRVVNLHASYMRMYKFAKVRARRLAKR